MKTFWIRSEVKQERIKTLTGFEAQTHRFVRRTCKVLLRQ